MADQNPAAATTPKPKPMHERKLIIGSADDRATVFTDAESGEKFVAFGDGLTLPYRSFISQALFDMVRGYLVTPGSNITALDGKQLAGLTGALLARQSRAPGTVIDVLAKEFLDEKGEINREKLAALIARILIQYGDDSVQELEFVTTVFNAISNIATKTVEDRRLGSYIEQSSRYVLYTERDPHTGWWMYYREPRIMASPYRDRFIKTMDTCFETYTALADALTVHYRSLKPIEDAEYAIRPSDPRKLRRSELETDAERREFDRVYGFDLRTRAADTARIVLPAATLTNMGMVANGRTYEYLLKVLYAADTPEFSDIAKRLHTTLSAVIPTYVKRAAPEGDPYLRTLRQTGEKMAAAEPALMTTDVLKDEIDLIAVPQLIDSTPDAEAHLLAAVLYPNSRASYRSMVNTFLKKDAAARGQMLRELVGERRSRFDRVPRGFENGNEVTVEVAGNFGIFRDLQRHRIMTLLRQRLSPFVGYTVPDDVEAVGFGERVRACAADVRSLYEDIEKNIGVSAAEYVVLFGHHVRFLMGMNLREAQHLLEIRTIVQGHPDYRRICMKIHDAIRQRAPHLEASGLFKFVNHQDVQWARAASEARQSQKMLAVDELASKQKSANP
jgi:thymidylate synthase ThyX